MNGDWRAKVALAVLSPQVLVSALLLLAAVGLALSVRVVAVPDPPVIDLGLADADVVAFDARLVLVDDAQLEWQRVVRLEAPDSAPQRLTAVLDALRQALTAEGLWPPALAVPAVFVETIDRAVYAVLDVRPPPDLGVTVARERALLRAITATAMANGIDEVRFLRDGRPAETLLGHVAVPSAL